MECLYWSVLFCAVMIIMVVVEALTVTMGLFTALAVFSAVLSVFMGFRASDTTGYVMLGVNALLLPGSLYVALTSLKHSPMMHHNEIAAGVPKEKKTVKPADQLVGQEGVALTDLRPSGTAQFGERRVDVVSDGKYVEAGQKVCVIKVSGMVVLVEPLLGAPADTKPA